MNWDADVGPAWDGSRFTLNVQPVLPFSLNDDWNLISRTILPIVALIEAGSERYSLDEFLTKQLTVIALTISATLDVRLVAEPVPKGSRVVRLSPDAASEHAPRQSP